MFISNIIYKLSTIIYKATTVPTNKDQQLCSTNINTGSAEPLLHDSFTHPAHGNKHVSLSLSCSYEPYSAYTCFTFITHILT